MRRIVTLLIIVLLSAGASACGGSSSGDKSDEALKGAGSSLVDITMSLDEQPERKRRS